MGQGIAQWFCQQQVNVELIDVNEESVNRAIKSIVSSWERLEQKEKFTSEEVRSFENNLYGTSLEKSKKDPDLVIEAVFEDLIVKKDLFEKLDKHLSPQTIIASNTSSFPMATLASDLPPARKDKFIGLHFFNPATIMKLIEIINSSWTRPQLAVELKSWFEEKGKKCAICADMPGFIVNRVARNFYGESFRILKNSNDQTKIKQIDEVLEKVGGFRMGPFKLMDLIGIDINYKVTQSVWESFFYEPRFAPHQVQKSMVDAKKFGKKVGEGFYKYE